MAAEKKRPLPVLRRTCLVATLVAIFWGPLALGAVEVRPWTAVPFWWLGALAMVSALGDRLASREPPSLGPIRFLLGGALVGVLYLLLRPLPNHDLFLRGLRGLTLVTALGLGFAGYHLAAVSRSTRRPLLLALVGIGALEGVMTVLQGPGGSGTYPNHAHFAGLIELTLPLALALALHEGNRKEVRGGAWYAAGFMLAGLGVSASRGGWFAGGASLAVFLFLAGRGAGSGRRRALAGVLLLSLGAGLLFTLGTAGKLVERKVGELVPGSLPAEQLIRIRLWEASLEMIRERPFFGHGLGNFRCVFPSFRPPGIVQEPRFSHNDYLQTGVEAGLVGLGGMLFLLGAMGVPLLVAGWRRQGTAKGLYASAAFAGMVGISLHGLVDFNFQIPANLGLLALIVGLGIGCGAPARNKRRGGVRAAVPRPFQVLATCVTGLYLVYGGGVLVHGTFMIQGQRALEAGQLLEAVDHLEKAAWCQPFSSITHRGRADARLQLGRTLDGTDRREALEGAREAARTALACARAQGRVLVVLSEIEASLAGNDPQARDRAHELLERANQISPHDPKVLFPLAVSYLRRGHQALGKQRWQEGLQAYPDSQKRVELVRRLGSAMGDPRWIMGALSPEFARCWEVLAGLLEERGYLEEATVAWDRALDGAPGDFSLRAGRGAFLVRIGRTPEALADLDAVRAAGAHREPEIMRQYLEALRQAERREEALALAREASALWGGDPTWMRFEGELLEELGERKPALAVFRHLAEEHPKSAVGPLAEARILVRDHGPEGDRQGLRDAASAYREALRRDSGGVEVRGELAELYFRLGDRDRALPLLEGLREEGAARPLHLYLLARLQAERGRTRSVVRLVRQALVSEPGLEYQGESARDWLLGFLGRQALRSVERAGGESQ